MFDPRCYIASLTCERDHVKGIRRPCPVLSQTEPVAAESRGGEGWEPRCTDVYNLRLEIQVHMWHLLYSFTVMNGYPYLCFIKNKVDPRLWKERQMKTPTIHEVIPQVRKQRYLILYCCHFSLANKHGNLGYIKIPFHWKGERNIRKTV